MSWSQLLTKAPKQVLQAPSASRVINRKPVEVLPKPELCTQRLVFRMLNPSDEGAFIHALERSRSAVRRWIPTNHLNESDAHFFHRTMMRARIQDIEASAWRRGAFLNNGQFVGMFNLIKIERGLEWSCEANWWVDSALTNRGLATEGVQAIVDYALATHPMGLGLHRVRAMICADNPASVQVAKRCGFASNGARELLEINKAIVAHDEYDCWVSDQAA